MKLIRHSITPGGAPFAPLVPPPLDAASAHASRRLFDARLPVFLRDTLGVRDFHCGFASAAPDYADPAVAELRIDTPSGPVSAYVLLDLERYPALSVCAWSEAQAADRRTSPELTLRNAVANVLCGPLLGCLDTLGLTGAQVVAVRRGASHAPRPRSVTVALSLTLRDQRHDALVQLPGRCIEWLDGCLARTARAGWLDASLRVPGSLVLGVKALSVDTLQSLRGGDILLRVFDPSLDAAWLHGAGARADTAPHPAAFATWGSAGLAHGRAAVAVQTRTITLLKEPVMTETTVLDTPEAALDAPDAERTVEVGELELPVQFVADTVALTIDEVSSLAPGYVIELPTAIADLTLKLVAHGQVIGHGELVGVGEHVGIRILRMAHEHGSVQ
ncbi:type III secretion system cytoplasmic ring protein SctQ [Burkholderia sp. Ac-20344]|uniref:type III secretion system cytoplasmic ring protein SctQ n=1 Tax=Burkholderia sp. Ac-20344 TaxID=2703890 RepID=UPI00197C5E90|nr:type III secretion system cytoplasmic ring protein SctQ [Burkholderia sp. Ac-20344]MBN3837605.1 YscQ/HrcQ family type III secretion apparatus protein [Burkholderia sp. Ac-20344]